MRVKPLFYTMQEVADLLCMAKQTLYNKICENKKFGSIHSVPPYLKQGGKTLFPIEDFHTWYQNQPLIISETEYERGTKQ